MSSMNIVKDSSGSYIPSSQRPDGTWRKPIRVKDGYVPQEEQPLYVSKGKQHKEYRANVPIGMTESDVVSYRSSEPSTNSRSGGAMFEVGMFQLPKATPKIPGLNFVDTPEPEKAPSKNAKKKSKSKSVTGAAAANGTTAQPKTEVKAPAPPPAANADPVKRLRNLRKKLKDIESLEKRIASGELQNPEKDQMEKIQRKDEVIDEIEDLEKLVEKLNLS